MTDCKYHPLSSSNSDEESDTSEYKPGKNFVHEKPKSIEKPGNISLLRTSEIFGDILSKNKVVTYDFNKLENTNTLLDGDITDADEIWLVQCPGQEADMDIIKNSTLDFDSSISKLKLKVNKKRKRYNVYAMRSSSDYINLALPSKITTSFHLRSFPLAGKVVLQKDVRIQNNADRSISSHHEDKTNNSTVVDYEPTDAIFKPNVSTENEIEVLKNTFKKKKKKKRSSSLNFTAEL